MEIVDLARHRNEISENGYTVINNVFTTEAMNTIASAIEMADKSNANFRKSEGLFAVRQFLKEIPEVTSHIFTTDFTHLISELFGGDFFVVKSIYFDKPEGSNWFVSYHQDLTISVKERVEQSGFGPWTVKQNQFAVQPPLDYLKNIATIRIHLDDTDATNGALKVIPGSHLKGIYRPETIDWNKETEATSCVAKGGIMIMKPLLLHASSRSTSQQQRRVIHIEMSNRALPGQLQWAEQMRVL